MLPVILSFFLLHSYGDAPKSFEPYVPVEVAYFKGKPIVQAKLNGHIAYFLVDTGAAISILNSKAAEEMEFGVSVSSHRPDLYGLTGGSATAMQAYKTDVFVSGWKLTHQWAATDMNDLVRLTKHRTRVKISGIIGSDLMQRFGFVIDYGTRKVWMSNPRGEKRKRKSTPRRQIVAY